MSNPNPYIALITVFSIIILGLIIYLMLGNNINNLKNFYIFLKKIKKFRQIFLLFSIAVGFFILIVTSAFKINITYLIMYVYLSYFTYSLIVVISNIISRKHSKWEFFSFLIKYMAIVIAYILLFAYLYWNTFLLNDGQFKFNKEIYILDFKKSLFISAITLLSYDVGFFPEGYMKFFLFLQVFVSQIVILGFLFSILGNLLWRYRRK